MIRAQREASLFLSPRFCFALAAGFLVFASRAWLIRTFGSSIPFWDEWDAEPVLYRGWLQGTLTWQQLLAPHNEHRILLTRLADLALFILQGRWNVWSQLVLNAVLHSATAAMIVGFLWKDLNRLARAGLVTGVVLLFSAPSGWQNALFGFQSTVYFTSFLLVAACGAFFYSAPLDVRWWCGGVMAASALVANAGGTLVAPAVLAGLFLFPTDFSKRRVIATTLLVGLFLFALLTRVTHPAHVPFHTQNARQFFGTLLHALSWPHIGSGWWWVVLQAPIAALVVFRRMQRTPLTSTERCAIALAAFTVLHAAAIAYSRGGGLRGFQILSRYQDPILIGAAAQLYAALLLAQNLDLPGRLTLVAWTSVVAFGLLHLSESHLTVNLRYKRAMDRENLAAVRAFLDAPADQRATFEPGMGGLHPDAAVVRSVLEDPLLQPRLPLLLQKVAPPDAGTPPFIIRHGLLLGLVAAMATIGQCILRYRPGSRPSGAA